MTIYNVNLGLVKDQRQTTLPVGTFELRFMDVASQIIPASVQVKSLAGPSSLRVLEQRYEYDLLNPQRLLEKYVGKEVRLYTENQYTERDETVTATLLSVDGGPVFKVDEDITFGHPGRILFPKVPDSLASKPTLVWLLENTLTKPQRIEATYLTNAINWRADYVLTLNARDDRADLSGWVTIDNKSGACLRQRHPETGGRGRQPGAGTTRSCAPGFSPGKGPPPRRRHPSSRRRNFSNTTSTPCSGRPPSRTTRPSRSASSAPTRCPSKKSSSISGRGSITRADTARRSPNQKINVIVELQNKKENNLGFPLPKGVVRVYKQDAEGSLQFVGEDSIDHTPKDEKIRIKMGNAFDVVGSPQTDRTGRSSPRTPMKPPSRFPSEITKKRTSSSRSWNPSPAPGPCSALRTSTRKPRPTWPNSR